MQVEESDSNTETCHPIPIVKYEETLQLDQISTQACHVKIQRLSDSSLHNYCTKPNYFLNCNHQSVESSVRNCYVKIQELSNSFLQNYNKKIDQSLEVDNNHENFEYSTKNCCVKIQRLSDNFVENLNKSNFDNLLMKSIYIKMI